MSFNGHSLEESYQFPDMQSAYPSTTADSASEAKELRLLYGYIYIYCVDVLQKSTWS